MVRRLIIGVALASAAAVTAAGCGGADKPEAPPEVAWAGTFCTTVGENTKLTLPAVDINDPKKANAALAQFLDTVSGKLQAQSGKLQSTTPPPVDGGQAALDQAKKKLSDTQAAVTSAATALRQAKVKDEATLKLAFAKAGKDMAKFGSYQGPVHDLRSNPKLSKAFDQAPACKTAG